MFNPCCCMSLQRGTIILAIIDAVLNGILLAFYVLALVGLILLKPSDYDEYEISEKDKMQAMVSCIVVILVSICQIILASYLRQGARQNDSHRCRRWLIIATALFAVGLIGLIVSLATSSNGTVLYMISGVFGLVYKLYEMSVVFSFMKELNNGGGLSNPYYSGA